MATGGLHLEKLKVSVIGTGYVGLGTAGFGTKVV